MQVAAAPSRPGRSKDPPQRVTWQPSAFNESFSSSDESVVNDVTDNAKNRPQAQTRRRRARPFPMRRKDIVRRSGTPEQAAEPMSDEHERSTIDAANSSDGQMHGPAPTWRRRKSSTLIPLQTPPSSPFGGDAGFHDMHEQQPFAVDEDFFHNSGSPVPPPSSTPMDVNTSSPRALISPRSARQADASDSDAVILSDGRRSSPDLSKHNPTDVDSTDEPSDDQEMNAKDRQRLKVLQRMMPRVLISRHLRNVEKPRPRRTATLSESSGSESRDEGQPLRPGESRIIRRTVSERANIDIRGDSESSDVEMVDVEHEINSSSSSSESDLDRVAVHRPRQTWHDTKQRSQQSAPTEEEDTDSDLGQEIGQWAPENPSRRNERSRNGPVRERDLIDRMLSRTRVTGSKKRKKNSTGTGRSRSVGKTSRNTLHIVTAGARRTGSGRQTVLPFDRASRSRSASPSIDVVGKPLSIFIGHHVLTVRETDEVHVHIQDGSSKAKTRRKRREPRNQGTLFMFAGEGGHLVSGRAHKAAVTIDAEQVTANVVPNVRLANRDRGSGAASKPKSRGTNTAANTERTLQDYWNEDEDAIQLHARSSVEPDAIYGIPSRRVTLDFNVPYLPAGLTFGTDCSLGRGCLHELLGIITAQREIHCPMPYSHANFDLRPTMSVQDFELVLEKTCQRMRDLFSQRDLPTTEGSRPWQSFFHSTVQHLSWLLGRATEAEYVSLCASLQRHLPQLRDIVDEPMEVLPEDEGPNVLELEIRWFILEASTRLECHRVKRYGVVEGTAVNLNIKRLLARLWGIGFRDLLRPFKDDEAGAPNAADLAFIRRVAELWVSAIHYVDAWSSAKDVVLDENDRLVSLWHILHGLVSHEGLLRDMPSEVAASEMLWRSIFTLCSLSQFSCTELPCHPLRIPASWQFVILALDRIKLAADPALEASLSKRSLHKRDEYIRILVGRCLILARTWKWPLGDASKLLEDASKALERLAVIFKSRRFANLSDEFPEFPSFLRHSNINLLSQNKPSDTAFTLLLKLIVKTADDTRPQTDENRGVVSQTQIFNKLSSFYVPLGTVPFTKATPPNRQQLSMVYNRFSAVAVAIYLDSSLGNLKYRLANARRYVNFKDVDDETRRACIRGLMHLAILLRHLRLPLQDIWDWLAHMTDILVDEYMQTHNGRVAVGIQMLLGCVRRILETPLMDPDQTVSEYPDPAWLKGPWVKRVFTLDTQLSANALTGMEIRKLVQSFLDARAAALPPPRRTRPSADTAEDSQESQEYFEMEEMNWDDPELVAALDPENSAKAQELKQKDEAVCEIIAQDIVETIYRLVMRHFSGPNDSETLEQYSDETDRWVDCWVGCASVLVQNGKRDWSWYLTLGPQSWEKISDDSWRRRVGLRFMMMVLRLDPSAYSAYQFQFLDVLLQCLVAAKITIEHEYMSLLCSIDGLRHPLLEDMPCTQDAESADYKISRKDFADKRLSFVQKIVANLGHHLLANPGPEPKTVALREKCVGSVLTMLATMQNIHQSLPTDSEERAKYTSFCQQVYSYFAPFHNLKTNPRLAPLAQWAGSL
ncbi:hypothetical protein EVJ58_g4250 [Rhodofomes roseus]|uniref:Mus7/MMS22 family-domain-containing protein n=1 Tax=Rhodofomes roseus TaxID=34475 RepID=A0A4Y9YH06_9APHY|nr:hypothetical protein EVJ58_g4250 [Rhodofomes roseus]